METAIHSLLLEVKPLAVLSSWEPIGARLETLTGAIRGTGNISERDLILLRSWARRWALLPAQVREFYANHIQLNDSETARVVLWKILDGKRAEGWMIRRLEALWEQDYRYQPIGIQLAPILR